jgi:hypothetical protein
MQVTGRLETQGYGERCSGKAEKLRPITYLGLTKMTRRAILLKFKPVPIKSRLTRNHRALKPPNAASTDRGGNARQHWWRTICAVLTVAFVGGCFDGKAETVANLEVNAVGRYSLNAKSIQSDQLTIALQTIHSQSPTLLLRISASPVARHEAVAQALESAKAAGIVKIVFGAEEQQ